MTCVCCGKGIPEGRQICFWCEANVTMEVHKSTDKEVVSELSKGELTAEILRLGKEVIELEKRFDKLSIGYLKLCKLVGFRH